MSGHVIDDAPVWVINGATGGFEVRCSCGWVSRLYETASLARAAADFHQAREGIRERKPERWWSRRKG